MRNPTGIIMVALVLMAAKCENIEDTQLNLESVEKAGMNIDLDTDVDLDTNVDSEEECTHQAPQTGTGDKWNGACQSSEDCPWKTGWPSSCANRPACADGSHCRTDLGDSALRTGYGGICEKTCDINDPSSCPADWAGLETTCIQYDALNPDAPLCFVTGCQAHSDCPDLTYCEKYKLCPDLNICYTYGDPVADAQGDCQGCKNCPVKGTICYPSNY